MHTIQITFTDHMSTTYEKDGFKVSSVTKISQMCYEQPNGTFYMCISVYLDTIGTSDVHSYVHDIICVHNAN